MTALTWGLLGLTLVIAMTDWFAVHTENRTLEYVAKPATMVPLIATAALLDPAVPAMKWWFVAALICSLAGDVFLMLPDPRMFVPGLGSFLVGHILFIIGLTRDSLSTGGIVVGAVLAFTLLMAIGPTLVKGAKDTDKQLAVPVLVYMLTISVMVTCAIGAGVWVGIVGALLFFLSDFCIGWSRFVSDFKGSRLAIIVTYHLAQILLVASLVVAR